MKRSVFSLLLFFLTAISCIDSYDLELPFNERRLVADVLLSDNESISHVTIGWTYPIEEGCYFEDFIGKFPVPCEPDDGQGPYLVTGFVEITEEETGAVYHADINMSDQKSFITFPITMDPTPGNHYALQIQTVYQGQVRNYYSETVMKPTPGIDDISYEIRAGDVGKSDNFVPLISFVEPETKEYYLFQLCEVYQGGSSVGCGHSRVWSYSVLSDQFLPSHVKNLSIDAGATIARYADFYPMPYPGSGAQVRMYSVSREVYDFYKALLEQFVNDGGAYAPTPATPKGNISGGAIGLFRVVDESAAAVYY